jgi:histidine phosphotransfer protein HptB
MLSGTPPIDQIKLAAIRHELGAHFSRILGYFAEDGVKSIAAIEQAVQARDAAAMVRPAHTLKGESLQFGAVALGVAAEQVEAKAREGVEDHSFPLDMVEHVICLRPLFDQALNALEQVTGVPFDAARAAPPEPAAVLAPPRPTAPTGNTVRRSVGGFGRKVG